MNSGLRPFQIIWTQLRRRSAFGADVLLTLSTQAGLSILALATGSLAARLLGPAGRGELAAVQNWPTMLGIIGTLGLAEATVFFSSRDPPAAGKVMATAITIVVLAALVLMLIAFVLMPFLLSAQAPWVIREARIFLLFIPINACTLVAYGALRGNEHLGLWNLMRILNGLAWLTILLIAKFSDLRSVEFVARGFLVATLGLLFLTLHLVRRSIRGLFQPEHAHAVSMLGYGLPSILGTLPADLNFRLDQLLIAATLAPGSLGLYAVAVSWSSGILALGKSVASVILPKLSQMSSSPTQTQVLARALRLTLLLSGTLGLLFLAVTPFAIRLLFGPEFQMAVPAALILVLATIVRGIGFVLASSLRGLGQPKWVTISEFVGLIVTCLSLWILLPRFDILGAAVASILGYGLAATCQFLFVLRETRARLSLFVLTSGDLRDIWQLTIPKVD